MLPNMSGLTSHVFLQKCKTIKFSLLVALFHVHNSHKWLVTTILENKDKDHFHRCNQFQLEGTVLTLSTQLLTHWERKSSHSETQESNRPLKMKKEGGEMVSWLWLTLAPHVPVPYCWVRPLRMSQGTTEYPGSPQYILKT